jgi:hypothetical protein
MLLGLLSILHDFVCIIMTIPATDMTTRQLFGGAITAILPKEYLDARCVAHYTLLGQTNEQ